MKVRHHDSVRWLGLRRAAEATSESAVICPDIMAFSFVQEIMEGLYCQARISVASLLNLISTNSKRACEKTLLFAVQDICDVGLG